MQEVNRWFCPLLSAEENPRVAEKNSLQRIPDPLPLMMFISNHLPNRTKKPLGAHGGFWSPVGCHPFFSAPPARFPPPEAEA